MTKREFLKTMDEIKSYWAKESSDPEEGTYSEYTCHAIELAQGNERRNFSSIRLEYEEIFKLYNDNTFDYYNVRIAALELFEIISLEEKLYLKY